MGSGERRRCRRWDAIPRTAALLAILASTASSEVLEVPSMHPTIQAAVDAALPGDEIVVRSGTYTEAVLLDKRTGIALRARGKVVIEPGIDRGAFQLNQCTGIALEGFTIRFASFAVSDWGSNGVTVERLRVERCLYGILGSHTGQLVVRSSSFRDVYTSAVRIDTWSGAPALVEDCVFRGFEWAIWLRGPGHQVIGNTLAGGRYDGIFVEGDYDGTPVVVEDNHVRDVGNAGFRLEYGAFVVRGNTLLRTGGSGITLWLASAVVEENVIRDTAMHGIAVSLADGCTFASNRVQRVAANGLDVASDACIASGNVVLQAGNDGIAWHGEGGQLVDNVVLRADRYGLRLGGMGNTLIANRARTSGEADLCEAQPGGNTIGSGNDFGTTSP